MSLRISTVGLYLPLSASRLDNVVVPMDTLKEGWFGIRAVRGGMRLLTAVGGKVVTITCLSITTLTTLTTNPFLGISRMVNCVVEDGWRVRIRAGFLCDKTVGLGGMWLEVEILPSLEVGKDYWINRNVVVLCLRQPEELLYTVIRARYTRRGEITRRIISPKGEQLGRGFSVVLRIAVMIWICSWNMRH
jgi:hypothetical protein